MRTVLLGLLLTLAATTRPSDACSVTPTYIAPTNVELVASSPRIVIARTKRSTGDQVEMEITHVLRGTGVAVGDPISVRGTTTRSRASVAPDVHPGAIREHATNNAAALL